MIRGIANRLGINWGLSDRWATIGNLIVYSNLLKSLISSLVDSSDT